MSKREGLGVTSLLVGAVGLGLAARAVARRLRRIDLRGKTVLITGGSRGLGLALARRLTAKGCRLAICARDEDELARVESELRERGADVFTASCDVTRPDQVEGFVQRVIERYGAIDALITSAATIRVGPLENMTERDFTDAMEDIFWGTFYPTMAVLPAMRKRRDGRIVHISSIGGKVAVPHLAPYSAAKFAVTGFSEGLRAELARENITVTTIAPGLMRTGGHLNAQFKGQPEKEYAWFALGATFPLTSMSADRAAAQIIDALEHGDGERVLSLPAKVLSLLHDLFPNFVASMMAAQNRYGLPNAGPQGEPVVGSEARRRTIPPMARDSVDELAELYHQFPGPFGGKRAPGQA
jgi:NAD(P)-dependent dehydrogenase (short-subunit alcohol dehydrogenase family)